MNRLVNWFDELFGSQFLEPHTNKRVKALEKK